MPDALRGSAAKMMLWAGIIVLIAVLDQATKTVMLGWLEEGQRFPVTGFFDLVLVYNSGAAFSFLSEHSGWQRWFFVVVTIVICTWLIRLIWQSRNERLLPVAFSLIVGGALGNLIDRFVHGSVVDFLYFYAGRYGWPAFNLADTAITLGVMLILWDMFRPGRRSVSPADSEHIS